MSVYEFGSIRFNSDNGELITAEGSKHLEPTVANLLVFFLENTERVLSRDEIMEAVWTGKVVSDDTINRAVSLLRNALDPRNKSSYIKTVPKRGYEVSFPASDVGSARLASSGIEGERGHEKTSPARTNYSALKIVSILLMIVIVGAALTTIQLYDTLDDEEDSVTVAVLPFLVVGDDPEQQYLGEGISDTIIATMSKQKELSVISKTSSFAVSQANQTITQIGEVLGADHILEGSAQVSNDQIRVNARLVEVKTQTQIWSSTFSGKTEEIFSMQDGIAQSALIAIVGSLMGLEHKTYRPDFKAYQQVMLGQHAMASDSTKGKSAAIKHFRRAIAMDEQYALAYVLLAKVYNRLNQTNPLLHEYQEKRYADSEILDLLNTALQKSPILSEAHAFKGKLHLQNRNYELAEISLTQALQLDPNSAEALADQATLLLEQNKVHEAVSVVRKAIEHDPQNSSLRQLLARALWRNGRAEEAIAVIKENIARNPDAQNNFALLSRWSLQLGDIPQAMRYGVDEWRLEPSNVNKHWNLCLIHAQAWDEQEALRCIDALLQRHPDYYEAQHWKFFIEGAFDDDLALVEQQVAANPDVLYHKLQLAEAYLRSGLPEPSIAILRPLFPELLTTPPEVNAANIWAARMLVNAKIEKDEQERALEFANAGLKFIEQSRKLQDGGFSSGVEDVTLLALIGKTEAALDILEDTVTKGWVFYSYFFFKDPPSKLAESERFEAIKEVQQNRMTSIQQRIRAELGSNIGY